MKINPRAIHRNLAYFYVGLIISFALSGILLNHRQDWNPSQYTYESKAIAVTAPANKEAVNDEYIASITKDLGVGGKPRGFRVRGKNIIVDYPNERFEIDLKSGKGTRESYIKTPFISQTRQIHIDTNYAWIWYSDIFGLAMLTIAITGMFVQKGEKGFRQRGWKLAAVGVIFPLIFLFLLS